MTELWGLRGKTCVVSGANSGIGFYTAIGLAERHARVVMVCRDKSRGEAAQQEIRRRSGSSDVDLILADLSSQKSIRRAAERIEKQCKQLHVLVNNAGVIAGERTVTEEGLELTFALNHLGYFLLTHLLLDRLVASAPSRIVNVSSEGHRLGRMNFDDLQGERHYNLMSAYNQSKLANLLFTYELARRLGGKGVTANAVHPGPVGSNFGSGSALWMRLGMVLARPFLRTPEKGARTSIHVATAPELEGVTGQYFKDCRLSRSSRKSRDEGAAKRLWKISEELTGISSH